MLVMEQNTRRFSGFGVQVGDVDGTALCRMFKDAIAGAGLLPRYLSSDSDPLFFYHRWMANLRVLEVEEIKTVPYVPLLVLEHQRLGDHGSNASRPRQF
jgi:hypothetical protein